jgi:hypothetical protein
MAFTAEEHNETNIWDKGDDTLWGGKTPGEIVAAAGEGPAAGPPKLLPSLGDLAAQQPPAGLDLKSQPPAAPPQAPSGLKKLIDAATGGIPAGPDWRVKLAPTLGQGKVDPRNIAKEERKQDMPPTPQP